MELIKPRPDEADPAPRSPDRAIHFGRYRIFPKLRLLLRDGNKVELGPRAFDVLCTLLEANGEVVTKDNLIERVWGRVVVEENNLQAQISAIRKALGPDRDMISTEFGRGYRLAVAGRDDAGFLSPPERETKPSSPELPHPVTSLLGRERELSEIKSLIGDHRYVTLVGPGGIGKTRLAIEVGRRLREDFRDGVHLAEMARVAEHSLVWPTIATALRAPSSAADVVEQTQSYVQDKHLLLIIDNCEQLADPIAETVETLLANAANLHILVTAQEPLDATGEHVYRLAPLSVPSMDKKTAEAALSHSAVQLFVERASANSYDFEFGDANAPDVSAICRRLDGMPLALELAAARVPALGIKGVLAGLDDRFKLLTAGRRTALPRHRTLRATVDWSHSLLDDDERRLFRRLAVFPLHFSADAAQHIAAPEHEEAWRVTDLLADLVAKSLLLSDVAGSAPRYRFLETIRFYALEKLADSGEVASTAERHAAFFVGVSRQAARDWKTFPSERWRQTYAHDIDDIRAALDWAFSSEGDKRAGIAILANSAPYWIQLSLHDECQRRLTFALDVQASHANIPPVEEMALQSALGNALSWAKGPVPQTQAAWTRACELADVLLDKEVQLQAHYGLWLYHLRCGQYLESLTHAKEMMNLSRSAGDFEGLAAGQRIAGVSRHFLGEHAEARSLIEASLKWYEAGHPAQNFRFGLDQHVAGLAFLSRILWVQGYSSDAMETASVALDEARALDHACTLCCAFAEGWCMVHALNGESEPVAQGAISLMSTASKHGLGFWRIYGEIFEAWSAAKRGASESICDRIAVVMASLGRIDFDPGYSTLLTDMLLTSGATRNQIDADAINVSFLMQTSHEDHWAAPEFIRVQTHLLSGTKSSTEKELTAALSLARRQGAHAWELKIAVDLAETFLEDQRRQEARHMLDATMSSFPDGRRSHTWNSASALQAQC
jgi:predicted ATPase/DNA-binding winged helix-turn-helix (wHTH) protein